MRGIVVSSLVLVLLLQLTFIACDWNQWANGNNGVHDRPVYRTQPIVKWSFKPPVPSVLPGVLNTKQQLLFWVLDKNGQVVYSFNDTVAGGCSGALVYENGIVYVLNDVAMRVSAVDIVNNTLRWTQRLDATGAFKPLSAPITIVQGNLLMVPRRDGFDALYKDTGVPTGFTGSYYVYGQFFKPTYSLYDGLTVFYWADSQMLKSSNANGFNIRVSSDLKYYDPHMYPLLMDHTTGEIYATLSVGSVSKYDRSGQKIWTANITVSNYTAIQHGPVLIDRSYLIVMANDSFYAINATTGEYNRVSIDEMTISQVKAQLYYSNNVLYATDGDGNLAAYDVTDRLNWKHLWTVNTGTKFIMGGGPSIASDGTIYVGSASGDADAPTLVALVSCPERQYLSENGTCVSCSSGEYFVNFNTTTAGCVLCGDGLVPNANRTACEECPSNTFSMSGDDVCTPCSEQPDNAQCPAPPFTSTASPKATPITPNLVSKAITDIDSNNVYVWLMMVPLIANLLT